MEKYKGFYQKYGCALTADHAGVTRQHVCRFAKQSKWTAPSTDQIRKNVLILILNKWFPDSENNIMKRETTSMK